MSTDAIRTSDIQTQPRAAVSTRSAASAGSGFLDAFDNAATGRKGANGAGEATRGAQTRGDGAGSNGSGPGRPGGPSASAAAVPASGAPAATADAAAPSAAGADDQSAPAQPVSDPAAAGANDGNAATARMTPLTAVSLLSGDPADPLAAQAEGPTSGAASRPRTTDESDAKAAPETAGADAKKSDDARGAIAALLMPIPAAAMRLDHLAVAGTSGGQAPGAGGQAFLATGTDTAAGAANAAAGGSDPSSSGGQPMVTVSSFSGSAQSALGSLGARLAAIKTTGGGQASVAAAPGTTDDEATAFKAAVDDAGKQSADATRSSTDKTADGSAAANADTGSGAALGGRAGASFGLPSGSADMRLPGLADHGNVDAVSARLAASAAQAAGASATGTDRPVVVNSLRIELNPENLGAVTATLRVSGNTLAIALKVSTDAAYNELSRGNDSLLDKLKGHGYVVEQVSVQHVGAPDRTQQPQQSAGGQQSAAQGQQDAGQQGGQAASGQRDGGSNGRTFGTEPAAGERVGPAAPGAGAGGDGSRGADGLYL